MSTLPQMATIVVTAVAAIVAAIVTAVVVLVLLAIRLWRLASQYRRKPSPSEG